MSLMNIRTVVIPSVGKLPLAEDPGTFTPSGKKRTPKPGRLPEDGGSITTNSMARLELNINLKPGLDVTEINNVDEQDITITLEDGQVHMMSGASCEDVVPIGNGESRVIFNSPTSERIG
jgi:hypothetical protein